MIRIYLYKTMLLLFGAAMTATGIVILLQGQMVMNYALIIAGAVIIVHGAHNLINYITKKGRINEKMRHHWLVVGLINIAGGLLLIFLHGMTIKLFYCWLAVYTLFNALIKFFDFVIAFQGRVDGSFGDLVACIFFFTFGIIMIFMPEIGSRGFLIVAGIYCIGYGVGQIKDFVWGFFSQKRKNKLRRRLRVVAPPFISTFLPYWFLKKYSAFLDERLEEPLEYTKEMTEKDDGMPPDVEVLIHVSDSSTGRFGHCDLCLDGQIISYGNYDEETFRLSRGIGDGILFTAEKERYIRFSVNHDQKTIISFGLRLTPFQKEAILNEIDAIRADTYEWKPPYQLEREASKKAVITDKYDYCSKLWNGTKANFYKFSKGKFKTYFVMSTNCVMLTDSIIGRAGADVVKLDGVLTPGTYFDYLQREYLLENSMVYKRTVYNKYSCEELFELEKEAARKVGNNNAR